MANEGKSQLLITFVATPEKVGEIDRPVRVRVTGRHGSQHGEHDEHDDERESQRPIDEPLPSLQDRQERQAAHHAPIAHGRAAAFAS